MSLDKNLDVLNTLDPELTNLYERRFQLKAELAKVEKELEIKHSDKINILRQMGVTSYEGKSQDYKITYKPARSYYSLRVAQDPVILKDFFLQVIESNYSREAMEKSIKLVDILVDSLLIEKFGYESYKVEKNKKIFDDLPKQSLESNFEY